MKVQSLISVLVLTCAIMLLASEKGSVLTGQIQDGSGFGLTSGSVEVYTKDAKHKLVHTALTDESGNYQLPQLPAGDYQIVVKSQGYEDKIQDVNIKDTSNNLGVITLEDNFITLEEAVIYGEASPGKVVLLETAVIYGKASGKKSPEIAKN